MADSVHSAERSETAEGSGPDVVMRDQLSSSQATSAEDYLSILFPSLAPPPEHWRTDIEELLRFLERTFLCNLETDFTQEMCARLPSILNSLIQALSRITGAFINAQAVYYNHKNPSTPLAYSTVTESISDYQTPDTIKNDFSFFLDHVFEHTKQSFERNPLKLYPTVYSTPFWRGRPVLCPKHPNPAQRRILPEEYFWLLMAWQGLKQVRWKEIVRRIAAGNPPPFANSRIPPNLRWHLPFAQWTNEEIDILYDWILSHQRRLHANDRDAEATALQFLERSDDEPFKTEGLPMAYDTETAFYYMAAQRYQFSDDVYLPLSVPSAKCFTAEFIDRWRTILSPELIKLLELIDAHELRGPPTRPRSESDPRILAEMPGTGEDLSAFLLSYTPPAATYTWNDEGYNDNNVRAMWRFVVQRKELVINGRVAGGRSGAFSVAMATLSLLRLRATLVHEPSKYEGDVIRWGQTKDEQIGRVVEALTSQIVNSLEAQIKPDIYTGVNSDRWVPSAIRLQIEDHETPEEFEWPYGPFGRGNFHVWADPSGSVDVPLGGSTPEPESAEPADLKVVTGEGSGAQPLRTHAASPIEQRGSEGEGLESAMEKKSSSSGSDIDPLWATFTETMDQRRTPQSAGRATTALPKAFTSPSRPSTDKVRPSALPSVEQPTSLKRAMSVGTVKEAISAEAPSSNLLGLVAGPVGFAKAASVPYSAKPTFSDTLSSSTPRRDLESAARPSPSGTDPAANQPRERSVSGGTKSRGESLSRGHSRTSSAAAGPSRKPSKSPSVAQLALTEPGDETISGSLLGRTAAALAYPETETGPTDNQRQPATASVTRRATRQSTATGKRAHSGSDDMSKQLGRKKSKSAERKGGPE